MTRWFVVLALVACKKPYDRDVFADVCSNHAGVAGTAELGTGPTDSQPFAVVKKWATSTGWTLDTPARLTEAGLVAPSAENYKRVQLVLCVEQQPGPFNHDCVMGAFETVMQVGGGDPAKVSVKDAGHTTTIKAHDAIYALTLREARTGRVIDASAVGVVARKCPTIVLGSSTIDYVSLDDAALVNFLAPHVPKPIGDRLLAAHD